MPSVSLEEPLFKIQFDQPTSAIRRSGASCELDLPLPVLGGKKVEYCPVPDAQVVEGDGILLLETPRNLVGAIVVPVEERLEDPSCIAYTKLLQAISSRKMHLHRVWNYVPHINHIGHGLEHYRQFNIGRWMAFEEVFGRDLRAFMPAASAVGIDDNHLTLFFIAGKTHPIYLENPSQIPAYHYPTEYGPRPPSFARAVLVQEDQESSIYGYLSGTASIEGHRTIGEGDWHLQFRTTMHNIQIMLERMNMMEVLESEDAAAAAGLTITDLRCYLRHAEMQPLIHEWLSEEAPYLATRTTYQLADICRTELDLEIEAVFSKRIL